MHEANPVIVHFTGFRKGYYARAIHEFLRSKEGSPRSLQDIVQATSSAGLHIENQWNRARDHLNYWTKKGVYVCIHGAWMINPRGVHFEPREWAD